VAVLRAFVTSARVFRFFLAARACSIGDTAPSSDDTADVRPAARAARVRLHDATKSRVSPYVLGGIGFARLMPKAQFTYSSGTLPDGSTPSVGDDVTSQLESSGAFTVPSAANAFMFMLGGGVEVPVARHWAVDAGYRFSRINADTPLNAQGATFGFGYRF